MAEPGKKILFVPAGGMGQGMGHLDRCVSFAMNAGPGCAISTDFLDDAARSYLRTRIDGAGFADAPSLKDGLSESDSWDFVLIDKRKTSVEELKRFMRFGTVICLDEGGPARRFAPYIVDAMPAAGHMEPPNAASHSFLDLPVRRRRETPGQVRKILVSFGGEDRADLSGAFLEKAMGRGRLHGADIDAVQGPLFRRTRWPAGVRVLKDVSLDPERLSAYDLVVTHYGLTALRSMALGVPTVLLNPSHYHRVLSIRTGIPEIGVGKPDMKAFDGLMADPVAMKAALDGFEKSRGGAGKGLIAHLKGLERGRGPACPACGRVLNAVAARFEDRTYFVCGCSGILYMERFDALRALYDSSYFAEEYRKQYGKTYVEDFDSIKKSGLARIDGMERFIRPPGTVVDVGCAYGPFLQALCERGFTPLGVDVSPDAVNYVKKNLGLPAIVSDFLTLEPGMIPSQPVKALTLWYVIEHFTALDAALKKAHELLRAGGVLAVSTPNGSGISARSNLRGFLEKSPGDHYSVLSPGSAARVLKRFGFDLKYVRITGHHPERFPSPWKKIFKGRMGRRLLEAASVAFGLGDTFEAYAVKRERS